MTDTNEVDYKVSCGDEAAFRVVPVDYLEDLAILRRLGSQLRHDRIDTTGIGRQITRAAERIGAMDEVDNLFEISGACPFKGEVTLELDGDQGYWTCPLCGHDHVEDLNPGPDPDQGRE